MTTFDDSRSVSPATVGRVFLVRHGRTAMNADGRLRGRLDPLLDEVGEREVAALAAELGRHRIVRIFTSPLTRAVQTAEAIGAVARRPVTTVDSLLDRDYGDWAGELETTVIGRFGSLDDVPGVEPAAAVKARARAVLDNQRDTLADGDVVLVSHDAVNKALLTDLDPQVAASLTQPTACWNEICLLDGRWVVTETDRTVAVEPVFGMPRR